MTAVALAVSCGLAAHADLLAAIVRVESVGNPLAIGLNGAIDLIRQPRDRVQAEYIARWLARHGYSFDAGLAQVNSANFARLGLDVATVFEPCANLRAASVVLGECDTRARASGGRGSAAWSATLSCYNTGHLTRGVRNGYAAAVLADLARPSAVDGGNAATGETRSSKHSDAFASPPPDAFAMSALASR